jgi:hypothetical protein
MGRLPIRRRLADERGQSLVLALLVLTVLAIALGTIIFFTSANQRNSAYQKASQVARSLAEAGVNNGISVLTKTAGTPANEDALVSTALLPTSQATAYTNTYSGGSVQWWGTFDGTEQSSSCPPPPDPNPNKTLVCAGVWTLHGTSTVTNPTGGAAIHRTMTAKMQVYRAQTADPADVWNWVYSPYRSGTNSCDTSFTNSVTIDVPVWVGGNLCANNTVQFENSLYVGGYLNLGNPQATVGSKSNPIGWQNPTPPQEVYVGAGCWYSNNPFYDPCVRDGTKVGGKAASTNVFANTLYTEVSGIPPTDTVFPNVAPPPLCWAAGDCPPDSANPPAGGWYSVASPGPLHPCSTASTQPSGNALPVFDNDTTWGPNEGQPNGSVPGVFNLTPDSYSYTCKTASGELSWSNITRTLTVQGVIFIDGSATAYTSGNKPVTYVGWGDNGQCTTLGSCQSVLFLTGTFLLTREHLCAVVNSSNNDCDPNTYPNNPNGWDPNKKILIVATHGQGGQLPANQGVNVITNQASFQGGLYAKYSIVTGQGGWVQGPLVSGLQTVVVGQSTTLSFPKITISPFAIDEPPAFMLCNSSVPCQPFDYTG